MDYMQNYLHFDIVLPLIDTAHGANGVSEVSGFYDDSNSNGNSNDTCNGSGSECDCLKKWNHTTGTTDRTNRTNGTNRTNTLESSYIGSDMPMCSEVYTGSAGVGVGMRVGVGIGSLCRVPHLIHCNLEKHTPPLGPSASISLTRNIVGNQGNHGKVHTSHTSSDVGNDIILSLKDAW